MKNLLFTLAFPFLIYCFIIVMLLTFYYPCEMKRVAGPNSMVAILKYEPSTITQPLFLFLLPILGTCDNCSVFVDIEKNGHKIDTLEIDNSDIPKSYIDNQFIWYNDVLLIIDEYAGITNKWKFKH